MHTDHHSLNASRSLVQLADLLPLSFPVLHCCLSLPLTPGLIPSTYWPAFI